MINIIEKNFQGKSLCSIIWKGKICWVAIQVAEILGYSNKSKAIIKCIEREQFEVGVEFDTIEGEELKELKKLIGDKIQSIKYSSTITIFYEYGLYGFLQYTHLEVGLKLKSWIRRDVIPQIREKGFYNLENREIMRLELEELERLKIENKRLKDEILKLKKEFETLSIFDFDMDKFQRLRLAFETMKLFKVMLDDLTLDTKYKFLFMKKIFNDSGFDLPKYIEEELDL